MSLSPINSMAPLQTIVTQLFNQLKKDIEISQIPESAKENFRKMVQCVLNMGKLFDGLKFMATTLRESNTASLNYIYKQSKALRNIAILIPIGGALIYLGQNSTSSAQAPEANPPFDYKKLIRIAGYATLLCTTGLLIKNSMNANNFILNQCGELIQKFDVAERLMKIS